MTSIALDANMGLDSAANHLFDNNTSSFLEDPLTTPHERGITPGRTIRMQASETTSRQLSDSGPDSNGSRRKRLSFFGRSSSDASTKDRPRPSLQATIMRSQKNDLLPLNASIDNNKRPGTSDSGTTPRRRTTATQLGSIRNSLFGGKKSALAKEQIISASRPESVRSRYSHSVDTTNPTLRSNSALSISSTLGIELPRPKSRDALQDFSNEKECG